ncbi:pseudouridine synthase [Mesorhizobium sp. CAU 1732]|uniref:pseudouridine synthase n=1 Tax=Mesorhizobium sp. CAU 1732 TaxID=3140358 RepID=UPI003261469E
MDNDNDKPKGPRGPKGKRPESGRDGPRKPFAKRADGDRKPAAADGERKPFVKREGGDRKPYAKPFAKREDGDRKPFVKRDDRAAADGERKPYAKPFAKREDGDRKPFVKRDDRPAAADGERKPFVKREGGDRKPYAKPFAKREDGDRKPFKRDDRAAADGERKPFVKREGGDRKPYAKPFAKREDGDRKPFVKRDDRPAADGERKPFVKREGGDRKPFRKPDGDRKPFVKRDGADGYAPRKPARAADTVANPVVSEQAGDGERIARRLARAGVASRRDAEEMIAAGRVALNGKVLDSPAINVSRSDRITVDGTEIPAVERTRLFLFNKPSGVVTTNRDPEGRKTVFDVLPNGLPRLMTVGRLDINTEGLLLLTNDGGLSRVLELPATGWLRRYRVRVHGKVQPEALGALKDGIAVDGVFYGSIEATLDREQGSNAWLTLSLREGKNREVKNVLASLGLDVTRLIRVSYGPFQLGELAEGEVRELKGKLLRDQLGERLIEESGADFEAPVINEFSNKPVARVEPKREEPTELYNKKREREQKREDALGRLQTSRPAGKSFGKPDRDGKPARGGKPFGGGGKDKRFDDRKPRDGKFGDGKPGGGKFGDRKPGGREERPAFEQRSRSANVWMAPGARPVGEKKKAEMAERTEGRRYAGKPRPQGKPGDKPAPRGTGPRKPRGDR